MKKLLLLLPLLFCLQTVFAQTKKHQWMAGGSALFHTITSQGVTTYNGVLDVGIRRTNWLIQPDVGYFLTDRFVAGVRLLYKSDRPKLVHGTPDWYYTPAYTHGAGPFLRYYILPSGKKINLLIDGSYQFGRQRNKGYVIMDNRVYSTYWMKSRGHTATISAGPVYNVNSKISIELLAAYTSSRYLKGLDKNNLFAAGLGFHVSL